MWSKSWEAHSAKGCDLDNADSYLFSGEHLYEL